MYHISKLATVLTGNTWFISLLVVILSWFAPAQESFLLLMFLVVADTITGIWVSISQKKPYTSKGLVPTLKKLGLYALLTVVFHALQVNFLKDTIHVFQALMAIPIIREVTSIAENIEALTGLKIVTKLNEVLGSVVADKSNDKEPEKKGADNPDA